MLINKGETTEVSGVQVELVESQWDALRLKIDNEIMNTALGENITIGNETYQVMMLWSPATYADGTRGDEHSFSLVIKAAELTKEDQG